MLTSASVSSARCAVSGLRLCSFLLYSSLHVTCLLLQAELPPLDVLDDMLEMDALDAWADGTPELIRHNTV